MLYQIIFSFLFCASIFSEEHVYLKTPRFSSDEIIGTNAGIRPYRKSGVRLESERFQDKLIVHNYGYGGSGITLCFGGAKEVMQLIDSENSSSKAVAVLGAGVIGLTTAYDLLEKGYEVHLYSDQWSPNLTSNVAAGIWSPLSFPSSLSEDKKKLHQKMLETAEQRFLKSTTDQPEFAGVRMIESYSFKTGSTQEVIKTKHHGEDVTVHFDNGTIKKGKRVNELGIDGKLFIEDLYSKVKSRGVVLEQKHFKNFEDIMDLKESIIVNCMSMGSREIFGDQDFIPIRGQMIYLKPQEGIDYLLYQNIISEIHCWVSIYPRSDRIILGGVYEYNEEEPIVNPAMIDRLLQNAQNCLSEDL